MAEYRDITKKEATQIAFDAAVKLPSPGREVIVKQEEVKIKGFYPGYGLDSVSYHDQTTWLVNSGGSFYLRVHTSVNGHG